MESNDCVLSYAVRAKTDAGGKEVDVKGGPATLPEDILNPK